MARDLISLKELLPPDRAAVFDMLVQKRVPFFKDHFPCTHTFCVVICRHVLILLIRRT